VQIAYCVNYCKLIWPTCLAKAQTGGAEGAQAPPLAIRILMFLFLVFHQHCTVSRDRVHCKMLFGSTTGAATHSLSNQEVMNFRDLRNIEGFEKYWRVLTGVRNNWPICPPVRRAATGVLCNWKCDVSANPPSMHKIIDSGNFAGRFLSEHNRRTLLLNSWTPSPYDFRVVHTSFQKRRFQVRWLEECNWLACSEIHEGSLCKWCVACVCTWCCQLRPLACW